MKARDHSELSAPSSGARERRCPRQGQPAALASLCAGCGGGGAGPRTETTSAELAPWPCGSFSTSPVVDISLAATIYIAGIWRRMQGPQTQAISWQRTPRALARPCPSPAAWRAGPSAPRSLPIFSHSSRISTQESQEALQKSRGKRGESKNRGGNLKGLGAPVRSLRWST